MRRFNRSAATLFAAILLLTGTSAQAQSESKATVQLVKRDGLVEVRIGSELFTTFRFGPDLPKPYFYPLIAPAGKEVTRKVPVDTGEDHPHQKSLWIAIDEVNEVDFWAEKGKIVNRSVTLVKPEGNPAVLRAMNEWQDASGKTVVTETTTVAIGANRLMQFEIVFNAGSSPVTFADTKEGLFGVRVHPELREDKGTGKITNADGMETEKNTWSKESRWVDYSGTVGGKPVGVAMFDHPDNFRKSRWHVRGYGLFAVNPFGGQAYTGDAANNGTYTVDAGKSLTLRYAVYVHNGDARQGEVAETYERYVAGSDKVTLQFKHQEGTTTTTKSVSKMHQKLNVGERELETRASNTVTLSSSVGKRGSDGRLPIQVRVDALSIQLALPMGIQLEFDSSKPAEPVDNPRLQALLDTYKARVGSSHTIVLGRNNEVAAVEGADKILENATPAAAEMLRNDINPDFLKRAAQQGLDILPTEPVKKGDTWTRKTSSRIGGGQILTYETRFEYLGTENKNGTDLHRIGSNAVSVTLTMDENAQSPLKVTQSDLKIESSQGLLWFDRDKGQTVESSSATRMVGDVTLSINGVDYPSKLDLTIESGSSIQK